MNTSVILLGSNTGNTRKHLEEATSYLSELAGEVVTASHYYETEPWGHRDQPFFLNRILVIRTRLSARQLLTEMMRIEEKMGRFRRMKWEPRVIDLDILYFNDAVISEPGLSVPHPHLHERRFTLVPLAEILPSMVHPVLKKSNKELLEALQDDLLVRECTLVNLQDK
jgi:2-amino-4-hydroxy-6-hydroxymethyldihydropteridine diphosphokinase